MIPSDVLPPSPKRFFHGTSDEFLDMLAQTLGLLAKDYRFKPAFSAYRDVILSGTTSVAEKSTPQRFRLQQNYPNPFNPETAIRYQLAAVNDVKVTIFDITGRRVRTLVHEVQNAGAYSVVWNGRDDRGEEVASGIYLYRLSAGTQTQARRMVLLR